MAARLRLSMQRRAGPTGTAVTTTEELSAERALLVVVDLWTRHPCAGADEHAARMIPALNRCLDTARALGIQIVFASSGDDLERWTDAPQRTGITHLARHPLPASNGFLAGHPQDGPWASPCMCPITRLVPGTRKPRFECRRQPHDPTQDARVVVRPSDLFIAAGHYVPAGLPSAIASWGQLAQQELWDLCRARGTTHLLYAGNATNMCVINREFGMIQMRRLGLVPVLVRDLTGAMTYVGYDPDAQRLDPAVTPAAGTARAVAYVEARIGPSIDSAELGGSRVYARGDRTPRQEGASRLED
jgi:nicotinamidase-related amidase